MENIHTDVGVYRVEVSLVTWLLVVFRFVK